MTNIVRLGGSPKYYFNNEHYGHVADFIKQGHDGKFVDNITTNSDNIFSVPAVRVRFVEKQKIDDKLDPVVFVQISNDSVDNTGYTTFQSSNISSFATSSLPFKDDNVITNRTYSPDAVEIS